MNKGIWLASALALSLGACANDAPGAESDDVSGLALRLTLPDGAQLGTIGYQVSGLATRNGTINVLNSREVRFRIGDLPVGAGYTLNLSAVTSAGVNCAGSAPFAINDNQLTTLSLSLRCGLGDVTETDTGGDVAVNVDVDNKPSVTCPVVSGISLLPSQTSVGTPIQIQGFSTSAPDSVSWSAPAGTFGSSSAASTSYTCTSAGNVTLTFGIQKAGCTASQYTAEVICNAGAAAPQLIWNEIESNGGTPDDWVELYNAGTESVNLSGYTFRDNDDTHIYAIPAGTTIAANGYLILEAFGFGLGSPDAARLFNASGQLVLSYEWGPHAATTYGRCPNLTGELVTTSSSTKGSANDCTPLLKLNEIESNGGSPDDWVEIYNAGFNVAELGGFKLLDNDDTHLYTFPTGTLVAPGAYYVIDTAVFGFGLGGADSVRLVSPSGTLVDSYTWTAHATTTYGRCPTGTGNFATTAQPTKGTANVCGVGVRINEVESSGGNPGDWVELYNGGATSVNLSGFTFRDNNDAQGYVLPANTVIAPNSFLVLEESAFIFGLGGGDAARLFDSAGALVDSYTWTTAATTTYGRCPDGSGDFATTASVTKGTSNDCGGSVASLWPGATTVQTVDVANTFPSNLSGLHYQPPVGAAPAALWAALNGPGKLYRLVQSGALWVQDAGEWATGKLLHYKDGSGEPDSEGVTKAGWDAAGIYVSTERNNQANGVSRLSVLRFDETLAGTELSATHEWNITSQLPAVGANAGLEAITWIPDSYLVARGFRDGLLAKTYAPSDYPNHGDGLFAVGVEGTGNVHVLALNHATESASILATFSGQLASVMDLAFDRDNGALFVACDDTCGNQITLFAIDQTAGSSTLGQFVLRKRIAPPSGLPLSNHEGITFQSEAQCVAGQKAFFWSDDSNLESHALRQGSLSCGSVL